MDQAIGRNDAEALSALLADEPRLTGTPIPVGQDWGEEQWLALHRAAEGGAGVLVGLLLEAGASVDARTRFRTPMHGRETALILAARSGHDGVAKLLLDHHADADLLDANHRSALSHAAEAGHTAIVKRLLGVGSAVDPVDDAGRTPLHWAIQGGHVEAAMDLIDAGADPNHRCPKEPKGYTPLHRCFSINRPEMRRVVDQLVAAGADHTLRDPRFNRTATELREGASMGPEGRPPRG